MQPTDSKSHDSTRVGGAPRVQQLIEDGLLCYTDGDVEGAISNWQEALSLEPGQKNAQEYVEFATRTLSEGHNEEAVGVPFGLEEMVGGDSASLAEGTVPASETPTRLSSEAIDEGWFLEDVTFDKEEVKASSGSEEIDALGSIAEGLETLIGDADDVGFALVEKEEPSKEELSRADHSIESDVIAPDFDSAANEFDLAHEEVTKGGKSGVMPLPRRGPAVVAVKDRAPKDLSPLSAVTAAMPVLSENADLAQMMDLELPKADFFDNEETSVEEAISAEDVLSSEDVGSDDLLVEFQDQITRNGDSPLGELEVSLSQGEDALPTDFAEQETTSAEVSLEEAGTTPIALDAESSVDFGGLNTESGSEEEYDESEPAGTEMEVAMYATSEAEEEAAAESISDEVTTYSSSDEEQESDAEASRDLAMYATAGEVEVKATNKVAEPEMYAASIEVADLEPEYAVAEEAVIDANDVDSQAVPHSIEDEITAGAAIPVDDEDSAVPDAMPAFAADDSRAGRAVSGVLHLAEAKRTPTLLGNGPTVQVSLEDLDLTDALAALEEDEPIRLDELAEAGVFSAEPEQPAETEFAPPNHDAETEIAVSSLDRLLEDANNSLPTGLSPSQRTSFRVNFFLGRVEEEFRKGATELAAEAATAAVGEAADDAEAEQLLANKSDLLLSVYRGFLGDSTRVPNLALPMHELELHQLDHRSAFLLSRVDGALNVEDILDVCGMSRLEAFQLLTGLVMRGVLELR